MLEILAVEHHFNKNYCLYELSLPDLLNYIGARNERIRQQNASYESSSSSSSTYTPRENRIEKPTISQIKSIFSDLNF